MTNDRLVMALPITDVAIPDGRIGFFDAQHAAFLGADMAENGQHDPIHVKRNGNAAKLPWTLVAGLHRLRGAEGIGRVEIDAIQVADAGASISDLRRLELSENLDHRQRRPIERAIFMAERARLEEEIDHPGNVGESQQKRGARVRHSAALPERAAMDWRSRTATAMGCSVKQLEKYQRIHRNIVEALPDLAERLNFHPLGVSLSAMTKLAAVPPKARRRAAEAVLSKPDWATMEEALVAASLKASTGQRIDPRNHKAVILGTWARMNLNDKRACLDEFSAHIPKGMARDLVIKLTRRWKL
ncbi:hypothetical protein [Sphingomonas oryzagri]